MISTMELRTLRREAVSGSKLTAQKSEKLADFEPIYMPIRKPAESLVHCGVHGFTSDCFFRQGGTAVGKGQTPWKSQKVKVLRAMVT